MKIHNLIFVVLSLFSLRGMAADQPSTPKEWFGCQKSADCAVAYACADTAINKKYLNQFQTKQTCKVTSPHDPNAEAICQKNMCSLKIVKMTDEGAIRKVVTEYINAAIRGDGGQMSSSFSKDAYVYGFIDGASYNGPATNLFAWTSANVPAKDLQYKIAKIDIEGTIATVRVEYDKFNVKQKAKPEAKEKLRKFTDMLSLLKIGSDWKIVTKVFHTHK